MIDGFTIAGQPVVVLGKAHNLFSKEHVGATPSPATNITGEKMKHTNVTVQENQIDTFPIISDVSELHDLEGSLWVNTDDNESRINMFCQTNDSHFTMIELAAGNRTFMPFHITNVPVDNLNRFRRFTGKVIIEVIE